MKNFSLAFFMIMLIAGCKGKENEKEPENTEPAFPMLSYIQSQAAHIDTSLYSIMLINYRDSLHSDTSYIRREDFRLAAKDFLELPDINEKKYRKRFQEEKIYDETMNRVIFRYTPIKPEKEDIQKAEIMVAPDLSGDRVTSIFVDQSFSNRDSSVQKLLLWQVDRSFTITRIIQKKGQAETTTVTKVAWNEGSEE